MLYRFLSILAFLAVPLAAQTGSHSDLQGIWTNATLTPLQRPSQWANQPAVSDAEAKKFEQAQAKDLSQEDGASDGPLIAAAGSSGTGGYNALFIDRGSELARVDGVKRTSLVIDPPNGLMPPQTQEAKDRFAALMKTMMGKYDNVKDRPTSERCLIGFGSTSGPPMLPVLYNNDYQIVQTADAVMIMVEMVHDARIIRINGTHKPPEIRQWLGDSIGHWEGDTLVVDTTNFLAENAYMGFGSEKMHVIERLRRIDKNTILYRATVDDPGTFTRAWTIEYPFNATPGPVYEYACHEGNYAMPDILGGARKMESATATKK
jgi:hypothetical protein